MAKHLLRILNSLVSLAVALALLSAGAYSAYALWDNSRVYAAAENVQADMLKLKPTLSADGEEDDASFAELRTINPDVCAWLTLDGTGIDYPVVQGKDNLAYINTDVYGDFSLAGAIFQDSRCAADFTDAYSLLYGHHMESGGMFTDIVQFTGADYFAAHTTGTLVTNSKTYGITLFACVQTDAYDPVLYDPGARSGPALLAYIQAHAVQYRAPGDGPVIGFSTCASGETNGRVILFGQLKTKEETAAS